MPAETIHECGCSPCRRDEAHPGREYHRHMNLLLSRLDEQQRRWYLAVESERLGYGADRILFEITGVDERPFDVVERSWRLPWWIARSTGYACRVPAARRQKKDLTIVAAVRELVEPETAGDP